AKQGGNCLLNLKPHLVQRGLRLPLVRCEVRVAGTLRLPGTQFVTASRKLSKVPVPRPRGIRAIGNKLLNSTAGRGVLEVFVERSLVDLGVGPWPGLASLPGLALRLLRKQVLYPCPDWGDHFPGAPWRLCGRGSGLPEVGWLRDWLGRRGLGKVRRCLLLEVRQSPDRLGRRGIRKFLLGWSRLIDRRCIAPGTRAARSPRLNE